jgi:hypothetical protein
VSIDANILQLTAYLLKADGFISSWTRFPHCQSLWRHFTGTVAFD